MKFWIIQGLNGLAFGSLLFILASGFSLIFGLMRIVNLSHGAYFMLGAYVGLSAIEAGANFWIAILIGGGAICILGAVIERFILRRLTGQPLAQVLVTLGIAFIIADTCVWIWTGDPRPMPMPRELAGAFRVSNLAFPIFFLFVIWGGVGLPCAP